MFQLTNVEIISLYQYSEKKESNNNQQSWIQRQRGTTAQLSSIHDQVISPKKSTEVNTETKLGCLSFRWFWTNSGACKTFEHPMAPHPYFYPRFSSIIFFT
jgi:hypothetical protein